ncbi:hypothetical protein JNJ66_02840 [Candidatus Saccharibacteria bacterium]|nr:hypothetical protein [Candidatus Saccharibacteria bacterium]
MSQRSEIAEREKVALFNLEELRRKYDELTASFDQLRNKVLAFIAGEIALIAFLFSNGITIPGTVFGVFFFLFGSGSITASFILLGISLRGATWHSPGSTTPSQTTSSLGALNKAYKNYSAAINNNMTIYSKRSRMFDNALTLLLIGVIILLVIKYGQGEIQWPNIVKT